MERDFTSPSGLWELNAETWGEYLPEAFPDTPIDIGHTGSITYLGPVDPGLGLGEPLFVSMGMYNGFFPASTPTPIVEGNLWHYPLAPGWSIFTGPYTILALSVLDDPTTWIWTVEYSSSGPSLSPVPEPTIVSLGLIACVAFATCGMVRRRA